MIDVSIVIPVFNEAGNIESLFGEIDSVCSALTEDVEIVFVDDGSGDDTFERVSAIARSDKRVCAVRLSRNCGQTAALQAGFDHARGSVVVTLDGDLQNDPTDIPRLLESIDAGADIVCGWRRKRVGESRRRIFASKVANWIIRKLTKLDLHDHGCGLKAFRRYVVKQQGIYSDMHRLIVPFIGAGSMRVSEVEIQHRPRSHGQSKYGGERVWKVSLDLFTLTLIGRNRSDPAIYFGLWSLPFMVLCFVAVVGSISTYLASSAGDQPSVVWPGIALLSSFAVLHFLSLAFIGELLIALPREQRWLANEGAPAVEEIRG